MLFSSRVHIVRCSLSAAMLFGMLDSIVFYSIVKSCIKLYLAF